MIKFFRSIRKTLLSEGKKSKYFKYAIGEIVLVVIGILIALQINNWNENRKSQEKIDNYFEKMLVEMRQKKDLLKNYQKGNLKFNQDVERIAHITADKNADSIPVLKSLLGSLTVAGDPNISFPVLDEFYNQDLQVAIKNDSLKIYLERLLDLRLVRNQVSSFALDQYITNVEPFYIKHINYSQTATNNYYYDGFLDKGPDTNYENLLYSMEFWNIINLKLDTNSTASRILEGLIITIDHIIELLEKEIKMQK